MREKVEAIDTDAEILICHLRFASHKIVLLCLPVSVHLAHLCEKDQLGEIIAA